MLPFDCRVVVANPLAVLACMWDWAVAVAMHRCMHACMHVCRASCSAAARLPLLPAAAAAPLG